ncbi:MAG: glycosyltransferase, partial [Deltaproteobacteria bacterium]|nr:glycosyltransferase [Deltaproteobacteria bacterium]
MSFKERLSNEKHTMKQIVVLPTYNEKDNLSKVVQQIFLALPQGIVLIVDDNSPDGTGELAETLKAELPEKIEVLHRTHKEGLGKAYLDGFQKALDLGAEQIFQMDADLSHPPALLTKMSEAL